MTTKNRANTWGYFIRPLEGWFEEKWCRECSHPHCHNTADWRAEYSYHKIEGDAHRELSYCRKHAEDFCKRHGLELPPLNQERSRGEGMGEKASRVE
jgi:hypothetical protein